MRCAVCGGPASPLFTGDRRFVVCAHATERYLAELREVAARWGDHLRSRPAADELALFEQP